MKNFPTDACLLAAGYGKRLRPITLKTPKPLVEVGGEPMLQRMADFVRDAGVSSLHVNAFYLGEQIADWCTGYRAKHSDVVLQNSREESLLETGGGIAKMLREHDGLHAAPFFSCNADIVCIEAPPPNQPSLRSVSSTPPQGGSEFLNPLRRMAEVMDDETDMVMLLAKKERSLGYEGAGDFVALEERDGVVHSFRRYDAARDEGREAYIFMGIQLLRPEIFTRSPEPLPETFSMNLLYNQRVQADGSFAHMKAVVHDGMFLHVGDVDGLSAANAYLNGHET